MSTTLHTPSRSPSSSQDFFSFHSCLQDMREPPFAPSRSSCRQPSATPPRRQPLLLTPSPLHRRAVCEFDFDSAMELDFDDFSAATGISTPFRPNAKSTLSTHGSRFEPDDELPAFLRPPDPPVNDDEEGLFLRSNVGHTSLPLRTPERLTLGPIHIPNSVTNPNFAHAPKRKINRMSSSPNAKRCFTPLHIHHALAEAEPLKQFATLAPLPAPRFLRERNSIGSTMGRQVDTLKAMRISDKTMDVESDSGSEEEFSSLKVRRTTNRSVRPSSSGARKMVPPVSPDRHLSKRRTKSRPVSMELANVATPALPSRPRSRACHGRKVSDTSISDAGSPLRLEKVLDKARPEPSRRLASSATLFFGPAIVDSKEAATAPRKVDLESSRTQPPSTPVKMDEESFNASSDSSFTSAFPKAGDASIQFSFSLTSDAPSPRSRIPTKFKKPRDSGVVLSDDEADDVLQPVLEQAKLTGSDSSRHSHARASTFPQPSSSITTSSEETLFDDSFVTPSHEKSRESKRLSNSLDVSLVDDFIVKTLEAGTKDGAAEKRPPGTPQKRMKTAFLGLPIHRPWASAAVDKMDRTPLFDDKLPGPNFGAIVDSGGSTGNHPGARKGSGLHGGPRKSCPAGLQFPQDDQILACSARVLRSGSSTASDTETSPTDARLMHPRNRTYGDVGLGRPSAKLNASQLLLRRSSSGAFSSLSEGSEGSNSVTPTRRSAIKKDNEFRVPMLPLKQICTPSKRPSHLTPLSPNLSPAVVETPGPRNSMRSQITFFGKRMKENKRPVSMHVTSSQAEILGKGGLNKFATPFPTRTKERAPHGGTRGNLFKSSQHQKELGRFEREFVEVDKIGSGEFGSAIKVRYEHEEEGRVYAIKKSKRFEGNRHRSRLREEVEILRHLSALAGPGFHPNILGYVDSWEQDDQLYILTELCEFGNFAHFLDEYGRQFRSLEEARVWKILADISTGLRFMHGVGVVHFDLKPANVFITAAGRFKIGDFGMASFWPRPSGFNGGDLDAHESSRSIDFEREGDKMYLAAEVLQGVYGKETDIFSFGMMMLEAATNICVPKQGDPWHRLREQDFSQVEGFIECSSVLQQLIASMMSKDPASRPSADDINSHRVVSRARLRMDMLLDELRACGELRPEILFKASPLAGVDDSFLPDILEMTAVADVMGMDCSA